MKRILFSILLLFFTVAIFGHREDSYYLQGSFGKEKVALQIDEFGTSCLAYFHNENDKIDHFFEGEFDADSTFNLKSFKWNQDKTIRTMKEQILVKEIELDVWEGTFINESGEKFPVALQPIALDTLNHPFKELIQENDINPYRAYRTKDIRFKRKRKEKVSEHLTIIHYIEKDSGIKWFRIEDKSNENALKEINIFLNRELFLLLNQKYSCNSNPQTENFEADYNIRLLNSELISFTIETLSACNGFANQKIERIHTLNLANAKPVLLEDLIWLSSSPYQKLSKGEYKWYQYRYKSFGKTLFQIIDENASDKFKSKLKNCELNTAKQWQLPLWYLTSNGIVFKTNENQLNCPLNIVIKYAELKNYFVEGYAFLESYNK